MVSKGDAAQVVDFTTLARYARRPWNVGNCTVYRSTVSGEVTVKSPAARK